MLSGQTSRAGVTSAAFLALLSALMAAFHPLIPFERRPDHDRVGNARIRHRHNISPTCSHWIYSTIAPFSLYQTGRLRRLLCMMR